LRKTIETYSSGKTMTEFIYPDKDNLKNYTIKEYFENGNPKFVGTVENRKFIGVKLNYYDNGKFREVDSILKPCDLDFCCCDGIVLKYYRNGKLDQTYENRNGVANGKVTIYTKDSTEKLDIVYTYKDDKKNGDFKSYYDNGKLYNTGIYRNDTLVEYEYYFDTNGDTLKSLFHYKGKVDFPVKKWLKNGQLFYATYIDSNYKKVLFRWTDKNGTEVKREIITPKDRNYILPD
jgi:antitoxin component YwqK of YwqJK toxin-antitoxin module